MASGHTRPNPNIRTKSSNERTENQNDLYTQVIKHPTKLFKASNYETES